jgi:hypothetical protein
MTKDDLKKRILAEADADKGALRFPCNKAHDISDELDVSLGRICKFATKRTFESRIASSVAFRADPRPLTYE